jgi:hypothetical protein
MEAQKTVYSQGNTEEKRAILEVSQYVTLSYSTEIQQYKQHGTVINTDMKTNGTE